jgi:hypothetical protein
MTSRSKAMLASYHQNRTWTAAKNAHQGLLLLLRELLVLNGIKGDRVIFLEVDRELLKVPILNVLAYQQCPRDLKR